MSKYFTSESVLPGHPDKIADQISDAILDKCLIFNKNARVAVETLVKNNNVVLAGEISGVSLDELNLEEIVKDTIYDIGYDNSNPTSFKPNNLNIIKIINNQSEQINKSVGNDQESIKAGDQGTVFGYATDETSFFVPASHMLAKELSNRLYYSVYWKELKNLMPDGKTQVTIKYDNDGNYAGIEHVSVSIWDLSQNPEKLLNFLHKKIFPEVFVKEFKLNKNTIITVNPPDGIFCLGGPEADCGVTGRKIISDTYGGHGSHGGGAFSGKDATKLDRTGAYAARYAAKNLVANGLCSKALIQYSYIMGYEEPVSISVDTFGTQKNNNVNLINVIKANFPLKPSEIIKKFDMTNPNREWTYKSAAAWGPFVPKNFPWEKIIKLKI
jgi:S-adenosylmethionine synthetase